MCGAWTRVPTPGPPANTAACLRGSRRCSPTRSVILDDPSKSLAWEEGTFGISVNSINPGFTNSDGARDFQKNILGRKPEEVQAEFAASDPLGRISSTSDVATFVTWLATDGRWVTGQLHTLRVYTS